MKTKARRNKAYQPKYCATNPLGEILGGMSGEHAAQLQRLLIRNALAMAQLVTGHGGRAQWDHVVGAINIGNVLCDQGFGNEWRAAMLAGRDALCAMGKRALGSARFVFTGDELVAVNLALSAHRAQLENIRMVDVDRASDEMVRRLRHGVKTVRVHEQRSMKDGVASGVA